jgi:hypothetical protein
MKYSKPFYQYRSAKTGKIVSEKFAKKHPKTTYKKKVRRKLPC